MEAFFSGDAESRARALRDGKDRVIASVATLAAGHGIRVLRGGGTVFPRHGLISPRVSPFTAFIVDPARVDELVAVLRGDGWAVMPSGRHMRLLPDAIVRLARDDFDGLIHLHGAIPGFFADPDEVFEFMWQNRGHMVVAGTEVPVLGRLCTVILAAHDRLEGQRYRRSIEGENFAYFVTQFRAALSQDERVTLAWEVGLFGADDELRPLLEGLALPVGEPVSPAEGYVRARLRRATVTPGDTWVVEHLERPRSHRAHGASPLLIAAALGRLIGSRRER